jgi:acetyl-CoA C-acetyltransferase
MHQYGTTSEQLAAIAVATRKHAVRNPDAVQAMKDLLFVNTGEITVEEVVTSRMIADPLHLLDSCMISDGGGAVIIAAPEVARDCKQKPAWIIGSGEATKYVENGGDITVSAGAQSAPPAFGQAGVRPDEIDIAMIYDSFTITVLVCLEDLGFCKKGEGGPFVEDGKLRVGGALPTNTDGGGLSACHPGMRGMFLLVEAVRQLRGECGERQVPGARLACVNGTGGWFSSASTTILGVA